MLPLSQGIAPSYSKNNQTPSQYHFQEQNITEFAANLPLHQASFCLCVQHLHGRHLTRHALLHPTWQTT